MNHYGKIILILFGVLYSLSVVYKILLDLGFIKVKKRNNHDRPETNHIRQS